MTKRTLKKRVAHIHNITIVSFVSYVLYRCCYYLALFRYVSYNVTP